MTCFIFGFTPSTVMNHLGQVPPAYGALVPLAQHLGGGEGGGGHGGGGEGGGGHVGGGEGAE